MRKEDVIPLFLSCWIALLTVQLAQLNNLALTSGNLDLARDVAKALEDTAELAGIVTAHPHSFRMYTCPWYAFPRSTDTYDRYMYQVWTDKQWEKKMRMTQASFTLLCNTLRHDVAGVGSNLKRPLEVERLVGTAVYYLAKGCDYDTAGDAFGVAESTACKAVQKFCVAVVKNMRNLIRRPDAARAQSMAAGFALDGLVGCIGSIDGTHVPVNRPRVDFAEDYYCVRKGAYTLNCQAVCDRDGYFWDG